MRPQSIVMFERLFLASLALSAVTFVLGYQDALAVIANDAAAQQFGLGAGFLLGVVAVSFAIYLLLWVLIARRASNAAKWILVVLTAFGVLSALPTLTGTLTTTLLLSLAVYALEVAAIVFLFRPDAKAWLGGKEPADPATFD